MAAITTLNEQSFDDAIAAAKAPLLIDFWAPWCGPCKAIAPLLEELAKELDGEASIAKVNVDENSAIAAKYHIRAIPTLLIFKDGKMVDQVVGMIGKDDLRRRLKNQI